MWQKSDKPGAFILTSRRDGKRYIMSEDTLNELTKRLGGEEEVKDLFDVKWEELTDDEVRIAERIRCLTGNVYKLVTITPDSRN